ncbi:MAG: SDR family oxidoreductase [SAR202 cluster bacterium]|nr:SDR family oxidoreductase [SAR202 cluster bacterium]
MGKLDGKVAVVTGAGTGIGKGIARALAREGCTVVVNGRNMDSLAVTVDEIKKSGGKALAVTGDVTQEAPVKHLFEEAVRQFKRVDILVNNAGRIAGGPLEDLTLEKWNDVMGVNVTGVFLCTREAFRIMKKQGGGRIINIGSLAAERPREESAPYTTSKHAVWGLTKSTALDGREHGISCGQLNPGNTAVERRLAAGGRSASGRDQGPEPLISVEDMARAALYMATLPPDANCLEMTVLPVQQAYLGRG